MELKLLLTNLNEQIDLHRSLLDELNKELFLTASCSLNEVETIQENKNKVAQQLQQKELDRKKIIQKYSLTKQINPNSSLEKIIQSSNKEFKKSLSKCKKELTRLIKEIQILGKKTALNSIARLESIQTVQSRIHRTFQRESTYSEQGTVNPTKGACFIEKSI